MGTLTKIYEQQQFTDRLNDEARQTYINQLTKYGDKTRTAINSANVELRNLSKFVQDTFENPIPESVRSGYQDYIRSAQAARGFGGGGSGVTGEEARLLFGLGEQRRQQLIPTALGLGQGYLQMAGLGSAQTLDLPTVHSLYASQRQSDQMVKTARLQRSLAIANTTISAVGALTGGIGNISSAYANYQAGQNAQVSRQYMPQLYESAIGELNRRGAQPGAEPMLEGGGFSNLPAYLTQGTNNRLDYAGAQQFAAPQYQLTAADLTRQANPGLYSSLNYANRYRGQAAGRLTGTDAALFSILGGLGADLSQYRSYGQQ